MNISIFGTGYVGLVTGASLAKYGHDVVCRDVNETVLKELEQGKVHFYEPGLENIVKKYLNKKLFFTNNAKEAIEHGSVIFNCVGTPPNKDGSANLESVFQVAKAVAEYTIDGSLLVNKSTVPPGTAKKCQEIMGIDFTNYVDVVSNPEFLREGQAVYDFTHPDKIVLGAHPTYANEVFTTMRKVYAGRRRHYLPIIETDWETAEMIKYANNVFLATKISLMNELANISDEVDADIVQVAQAMGLDFRISNKFLNAGTGYGGSCFPKDVRALINVAGTYDAKLLKEVHELNERQKHVLTNKLNKHYDSIDNKIFTVWGLSFKPKTSDVRDSPALEVVNDLLNSGAKVKVYDPLAMEEAKKELSNSVEYSTTIEDSVKDSSGILLITEWDEFRNVNFDNLKKLMKKPLILDGRNIYEPEELEENGFEHEGVGR